MKDSQCETQNRILEQGSIPEIPVWFPTARLNYAENLLSRKDDGIALTEATEDGRIVNVSFRELNERVRSMAAALRVAGLKVGDRVAGALSSRICVPCWTRGINSRLTTSVSYCN